MIIPKNMTDVIIKNKSLTKKSHHQKLTAFSIADSQKCEDCEEVKIAKSKLKLLRIQLKIKRSDTFIRL